MNEILLGLNAASAFVVALAAAYFFLAAGLGVLQLRRDGTRLDFQSHLSFGRPYEPLADAPSADQGKWHLYFLVPCLNESAVIGATVSALVDPATRSQTVVIDDGCDDDTAQVALSAGGDQVRIVGRTLPEARKGKGAALNAGYRVVLDHVAQRNLDPEQVIVCVMDADGRLSDGAIDEVLALFDDTNVGGVQLAVRIRNRNDNFWLRFQDHQFWALSSLTQFGRIRTGTVSLGGNGQFTRLSAMQELGDEPWTSSLTEDLDLAISLSTRGWRLTSTPRAAVDQQGVARFRALIKQRTRWYQGHMMTGRRLPQVLRSRAMSNAAAIEMSLYLLVPWLLDLPWSILYHVILVEITLRLTQGGVFNGNPVSIAISCLVWYLLAFWPAIVTAVMAKRRDGSLTWRRTLKFGHAFVVTNYLSYICAWVALSRIVRGSNSWAKTERSAEGAEFIAQSVLASSAAGQRRATTVPVAPGPSCALITGSSSAT